MPRQQRIGPRVEPAVMSGFAHHWPSMTLTQQREETARNTWLEGQRGWQLHDQGTQTPSKSGHTFEEAIERPARRTQPLVVRDLARELHCKPERARSLCRPARVGVGRVIAVEGR